MRFCKILREKLAGRRYREVAQLIRKISHGEDGDIVLSQTGLGRPYLLDCVQFLVRRFDDQPKPGVAGVVHLGIPA